FASRDGRRLTCNQTVMSGETSIGFVDFTAQRGRTLRDMSSVAGLAGFHCRDDRDERGALQPYGLRSPARRAVGREVRCAQQRLDAISLAAPVAYPVRLDGTGGMG